MALIFLVTMTLGLSGERGLGSVANDTGLTTPENSRSRGPARGAAAAAAA
jgi:hypothetical protein